ncbi:MAG: pyrroline-5-carboxylate reductase [Clostridia bacterium]|nr:pyrroline-5-carboxylate reductase [Clostridia bacterium]
MKLGFIGTGNLASAILRGVVAAGRILPGEILIYDIFTEKANQLCEELSVNAAESASQVAAECEKIVIAVKPKDFAALADEIKDEVRKNNSLVISTAAGTEISKISSCFGFDAKIVRIMPNLNAAAGESMTAYCASPCVADEEKVFANEFCSCFGKCVELEEKYFSAFTAIAGSAPAFAFMFADAVATAGIKYGLPSKTAQDIAAQMLFGSAKLMLESPLAVSDLIRNVCSPGGTTVEGVCSLKETGFESSVITAVDKTVEKDRLMSALK